MFLLLYDSSRTFNEAELVGQALAVTSDGMMKQDLIITFEPTAILGEYPGRRSWGMGGRSILHFPL
jgi:hypothetical protein